MKKLNQPKKLTPKQVALGDMREEEINCSVFRKERAITHQPIVTIRDRNL